MTENDIKANFLAIREITTKIAASDRDEPEREMLKALVGSSLSLLEALLLDINRIANCAEEELRIKQ